jgi:hypothetical protein
VKRALIKIGRLYNSESDIPEGRTRYQRGAMRFGLPGRTEPIPLVVDHNLERQIGIVDELAELDDADGIWLTARCRLTEQPPWLKRGTGASMGYKPLWSQQIGAGHCVRDAILEEVTVVLRQAPREPLAKVALLYTPEPKLAPAAKPTRLPSQRRRRTGVDEMAELRRRLDAAGPAADFETILEHLKDELGYSSRPWWQAYSKAA